MSAAAAAPSPDQVAGDDDEPPSPGPHRGAHDVPTVVAADERDHDDPHVQLEPLALLLGAVLAAEGAPAGAEASLTLVDTAVMAELKAEHLGGDGTPTDVLSFPVDGVDDAAELIGDVVVCVEVARQQAPEHAGTTEDELALLVVHAGLHLAGWDHATADERARMWGRERELLVALHRHPERDPWSEPSP